MARMTKCLNCGGTGSRKRPWGGYEQCSVCLGFGKVALPKFQKRGY